MNTTLAALLSAALFLLASVARYRSNSPASRGAALGGAFLAAFAIEAAITTPAGMVLGVGPMLALFAWFMVLAHLLLRNRLQLHPLDISVWTLAALAVALGILSHEPAGTGSGELSTALRAHIVMSLAAWAVLSLAAMQAIAGSVQAHRLRAHQSALFDLPLTALEQSSFRLLTIGWVLLVGGVATGFLFVENFIAQHLAHKAFLTIFATALFGVLLIGRSLRGWRGDQALRWIVAAWVMLGVGYAGVKLILEYGLDRSWS